MTNKTFLTIHTAIYTLFGIALFAIPSFLWPMYGVEINDKYAYFLSQHNSIFLGGLAIISFLFRDVELKSSTAIKIITGLFWCNALGLMVTLYAALTSIFTGLGWSDPAFFAFMTILSYMQLRKNS